MSKDKGFAIINKGTRNATGVMRGRDVREQLRGKIDPDTLAVLERIAEINHINMNAIAELATHMDQIVDLVQKFSDIAGNMKDRTDQMARAMGEGSADDTTH